MKLDYYDLPFGAQILLWTSRVLINGSCRSVPNKYELVDLAYKKIGIVTGLILLKDFLYLIKSEDSFTLQSICERELIDNEINLINCIENNKYNDSNNHYYVKFWNISDKLSEFSKAAGKISKEFNKFNLNTNINTISTENLINRNKLLINNTLH